MTAEIERLRAELAAAQRALAEQTAEKLWRGEAVTEEGVREMMRMWIDRDYAGSRKDAAEAWKIDPTYLSLYIRGHRKMGPTLQRVAGLRREVTVQYRLAEAAVQRDAERDAERDAQRAAERDAKRDAERAAARAAALIGKG